MNREQINFRIDPEIREAIDDIRAMMRPVPTMSEVFRIAILEKRDALKRKMAAQERRG